MVIQATFRLQKIADLLLLNSNLLKDPGLLNGKTGIAIFFYHYAKFSSHDVYRVYADSLILDVFDQVNTTTLIDFANGLTGIGWGIEYLVQKGFMKVDKNDAHQTLDGRIADALAQYASSENVNSLTSLGCYCLLRYKGKRSPIDSFDVTQVRQLNTLGGLYTRLLTIKRSEAGSLFSNLTELNLLINLLIQNHQLGLSNGWDKTTCKNLIFQIHNMISKSGDAIQELRLLRFQLKNLYSIIEQLNLAESYHAVLALLDKVIERNTDGDNEVVDAFILTSLHSLMYGIDVKSFYNKHPPIHEVLRIVNDDKNWNHRLIQLDNTNLGLSGLAGLGLALVQRIKASSGDSECIGFDEI